MSVYKSAFIFTTLDADPKKNRSVIKTDRIEMHSIAVKDYEQGVEIAKEMVENEKVKSILLCPGFGNIGTGKIAEAVREKAFVGTVRFDVLPLLGCKSPDTLFCQKK